MKQAQQSIDTEYECRSVRHCLAMLAPFRTAFPANCAFSQDRIAAGEQQFYDFMRTLYQEMAEDPAAYHVPVGAYSAYLARVKERENEEIQQKERHHAADARESTLRNTFQQGIAFYARFFYELGLRMERVEDDCAVLRHAAMNEVVQMLDRLHVRAMNAARYAKLEELGVVITVGPEIMRVSCVEKPDLFVGLWVLAKAGGKYAFMNYLRLDYRAAVAGVPCVEDVLDTLDEGPREIVRAVDRLMRELHYREKIKPLRGITSDFRWKVEYQTKGKNVFGFYASPDDVTLCIYFGSAQHITEMAETLEFEDPVLYDWFQTQFPERLCRCSYNRVAVFGGVRRRICGMSNRAEIEHANRLDLERAIMVFHKFHAK